VDAQRKVRSEEGLPRRDARRGRGRSTLWDLAIGEKPWSRSSMASRSQTAANAVAARRQLGPAMASESSARTSDAKAVAVAPTTATSLTVGANPSSESRTVEPPCMTRAREPVDSAQGKHPWRASRRRDPPAAHGFDQARVSVFLQAPGAERNGLREGRSAPSHLRACPFGSCQRERRAAARASEPNCSAISRRASTACSGCPAARAWSAEWRSAVTASVDR